MISSARFAAIHLNGSYKLLAVILRPAPNVALKGWYVSWLAGMVHQSLRGPDFTAMTMGKRKAMAKVKFGKEEQIKIAKRYAVGRETSTALAEEYGISSVTVLNYVKRNGYKVRTLKEHGKYYSTGEEAAKNSKYKKYKAQAKYRGLVFSLSKEEFFLVCELCCHYCGAEPSNVNVSDSGYGSWTYNGLDRVDSSVGYISNNVVPCCKICNRAKSDMSYDDFVLWIGRLS